MASLLASGHQKVIDHRLVTFYRKSARGAFLFYGFRLFSSPARTFWFRCARLLPARLACQRSLWVPYHLRYDPRCSRMLPLAASHDSVHLRALQLHAGVGSRLYARSTPPPLVRFRNGLQPQAPQLAPHWGGGADNPSRSRPRKNQQSSIDGPRKIHQISL